MKYIRTTNLLILSVFILILRNYCPIVAQTEVSGNITKDTTWTKDNSPYIVTGTIQVLKGVTLEIEPGVTVKFNEGLSLNVGGILIAKGNLGNNIIFTSNREMPQPGDWGSIKFVDSSIDAVFDKNGNYISGSIIENSIIESGGNNPNTIVSDGVIVCKSSSPFINGNTIQHNAALVGGSSNGGGIHCMAGSNPVINNNVIKDNRFSNSGGGIRCEQSSPTITNNRILDNEEPNLGGGIYLWGGSPKIIGNQIVGNSGRSGGGIYCEPSTEPYISKNIISLNTVIKHGGGIFLVSSASAVVKFNNIFDNKKYNIELFLNSPGIDATENWWGTTNEDSISAHIYDYWDDMELGEVHYEPFLTSATPINITSVELKTDNTYLTNLTTTLSILDTLYIELTGTDGDESHQDTTTACIINESKSDSISVKLFETSLNTGIYRGIAYFSSETDDDSDLIGTEKGDNIKIVSAADNTVYKQFLSIVPVELCLFIENLESNNNVILNWKTLSETNNFGFEIQRSIDKVKFEKVGFVIGNGTTSEIRNYIFTDKNINTGTYYYRLKQTDFDGSYEYSQIIEVFIGFSDNYCLYQNYPNPFNPITTIKYETPKISDVTIKVFNILGQEIKTFTYKDQLPGSYEIIWDGINNYGTLVSSGIYLYHFQASEFIQVKKMVFLR